MKELKLVRHFSKEPLDNVTKNRLTNKRDGAIKSRVYIKEFGFCPVISVSDNGHLVLLPNMKTITMRIEKVF